MIPIDKKTIPFLRGEQFSSAFIFKFKKDNGNIVYRISYLEKLVFKKNIIHVGCLDHIPLVEDKIKRNQWLHKRLNESSQKCIGIDINKEGIEYVRKLGFDNIFYHDIINDKPNDIIIKEKWDYMLLGEILEHIENPTLFLGSIINKYHNIVDKLIISVPYAFSYHNFRNAIKGVEAINSDRYYWFTPYTLARIITKGGGEIEGYQMCVNYTLYRFSIFSRLIYRYFPALRNSLVVIVKI